MAWNQGTLLKGEAYERGSQQGYLVKDQILATVSVLRDVLAQKDRERISALAATVDSNLLPDEREEIRGISDATGIPYDGILMLNLADRKSVV